MATPRRTGEAMVGQYRRLESIGKGSFATVYKALEPSDNTLIAIKTVQHANLKGKVRANLFTEIEILKGIHHPHIVALINILESQNHIHIVTEFCQLGDLATFVRKRDKLAAHPVTAEMMRNYPNPPGAGFHEAIVRHFLQQIVLAMKFLLDRDIIHRDVKPQNILLNPPESWIMQDNPANRPFQVSRDSFTPQAGVASFPVLKIADFGFARYLPQASMAETLCGSPLYMAPEILRYEKYDAQADLWSIGAVTFELCVGKPPFRAANHVELLQRIQRANDKIPITDATRITPDMRGFICNLLKQHQRDRLTWKDVFEHPVICDEIPGLLPADRSSWKPALPPQQRTETPQQEVRQAIPEATTKVQDAPPPARVRNSSDNTPSRPGVSRAVTSAPPKRPQLTSHATEPAIQGMRHDRLSSSPAEQLRPEVAQPSQPSSPAPPKSAPERRPSTQHMRSKHSRDERQRAAEDVAFERDYVVIQKKAVEVNAFADEMAASPRLQTGSSPRSPTSNVGAMLRRATTQGLPMLNPSQASPTRNAHQDLVHRRTPSYDRPVAERKPSANSAIASALHAAAARVGLPIPMYYAQAKGVPSPQSYGPYPAFPATPAGPLKIGDRPMALQEDQKVVYAIEEDATRSDTVFSFAEVKYKQLVPQAPSSDNRLGVYKANGDDLVDDDEVLTTDAVIAISEEALVLYVKCLAILNNTFNLAGLWWTHRRRRQSQGEISVSPRMTDNATDKDNAEYRVNNVVQWARNRFNECLEKSEYASRRLADAQRKLSTSRSREGSRPSSSTSQSVDTRSQASDIRLSGRVTAEKIMYDRAIEMSKAAAVNELSGQDLEGCELTYMTAIRLMDAVLEVDEDALDKKNKSSRGEQKDDVVDGIEESDRKSVVAISEQMRIRLHTLRKKVAALALQEVQDSASKRASLRPGLVPAEAAAALRHGAEPATVV